MLVWQCMATRQNRIGCIIDERDAWHPTATRPVMENTRPLTKLRSALRTLGSKPSVYSTKIPRKAPPTTRKPQPKRALHKSISMMIGTNWIYFTPSHPLPSTHLTNGIWATDRNLGRRAEILSVWSEILGVCLFSVFLPGAMFHHKGFACETNSNWPQNQIQEATLLVWSHKVRFSQKSISPKNHPFAQKNVSSSHFRLQILQTQRFQTCTSSKSRIFGNWFYGVQPGTASLALEF